MGSVNSFSRVKDLDCNKYVASVPRFGNLFYRKNNVAYTHSGVFHGDDVSSAALLQITFPGIEIKRVAEVPEDAELAFDIGHGKYDHHQSTAELREDGSKYSSFGLLWKDIGPTILTPENVKLFDDVFVRGIDFTDNTGAPNPFSSAIKAFNPAWDKSDEADERFFEAVEWAKVAIINQFKRFDSAARADEYIENRMKDIDAYPTPHSLLLETYMPYQKFVVNSEVCWVCYPSNRDIGGWNINTVPVEVGMRTSKKPFPDSWFKDEMPDGCTFIHPGKYLAVFKSLDKAIKALEMLEKYYE